MRGGCNGAATSGKVAPIGASIALAATAQNTAEGKSMPPLPLTLVFSDGKRLHVREADGVPREGDHALVMGVYYRVEAVVWQFGRELQDGDRSVPSVPVEIHLRSASPSAGVSASARDCSPS